MQDPTLALVLAALTFLCGLLGIAWKAGRSIAQIEQRLENIEDNALSHLETTIKEIKTDVRDLRKVFLERSTSAKKS